MIVYDSLEDFKKLPPSCVALGNFDGVHLGHQSLIEKAVKKGMEENLETVVFTFSNHPKDLIPNNPKHKYILKPRDKEKIIEKLGVDYLVSIPFNKEIMGLSPEAFVKEILVDKLNIKYSFCGFNYNFGYKAEGDVKILRDLGEKYHYEVFEMEPFLVDNKVVSSTLIRKFIKEGSLDKINSLMGRNYSIAGKVVVGNKLGRTIGFPTSNLTIDESMVTLPNGVYITNCIYKGRTYPSITNVGNKPTIGEYNKNVETHIFNFNKELYGKYIKVEFIKKMRDEKKFEDIDSLSKQIIEDCSEAKAFHKI